MKSMIRVCFLAVWASAALVIAQGSLKGNPQESKKQNGMSGMSCDAHMSQMTHTDQVNQRGDHVMGFDHMKTTHHFRLLTTGGAIEVNANDPADTASRDQIRHHLTHISHMFAEGDFTAPMLIHNRVPPGVEKMKSLKADISYTFQETDRGGRVVISTQNPEALQAVHEFLTFQIKDHQTGDTTEVQNL